MKFVEGLIKGFEGLAPYMSPRGFASLITSAAGGLMLVWGAVGQITIGDKFTGTIAETWVRATMFVVGLIVLVLGQSLFLWSIRKEPVRFLRLGYRFDDGGTPKMVLACPGVDQAIGLTTLRMKNAGPNDHLWLDLVTGGRHYPRPVNLIGAGGHECGELVFWGAGGSAASYEGTVYRADATADGRLAERVLGWDAARAWPGIESLDWNDAGLTPLMSFTASRVTVTPGSPSEAATGAQAKSAQAADAQTPAVV